MRWGHGRGSALMLYPVAVLLGRELADHPLAGVYLEPRLGDGDAFERAFVGDVDDLIEVVIGPRLARARALVRKFAMLAIVEPAVDRRAIAAS